jgi:hypothetical protein
METTAAGGLAAFVERLIKSKISGRYQMRSLLVLFGLLALVASAADISGTWKAEAEGPNGSMERTFVFKVDGNKLTGKTTSSMLGESVINDGKVEGDTLSFTIKVNFGGEDMNLQYKGKVSGETMKLTVEAAGNTIEWNAKKAS